MRVNRIWGVVTAWSAICCLAASSAAAAEEREPQPLTVTVVSNAESSLGASGEQLVSMDFQDASLKDVLKIFSQQTGLNVIASEDVKDQTLTLYLEGVTALDALDQILVSSGLVYDRAPGSQIYVVKPKPPADKPKLVTETRVYKLKYARVSTSKLAKAAEAFSEITPFESSRQLVSPGGGGSSGGGGGSSGGGSSGGGGGSGGSAEDEVGVDKVMEKLVTSNGKVAVDERTNSLVVTDVPDNFPRIESALSALDVKTAQILIEAEVLETTVSKLTDVGVEWGSDAEGTLLATTGGQKATQFPFVFVREKSQTFVAPEGTVPDGFTKPGIISLGTIDASHFTSALQALERDANTKILARPKVLTLDNESAVIKLSSLQAIATQTLTSAGDGLTSQTTNAPERVTTGVILTVTPQVNESEYITMLVEPSVTKIVASAISTSIKDPKTRSARALVRIRHGETLVLGGLIDRSETETKTKIPLLGDLPLIGAAFRNKETDDSVSELIVFVTPRILTESSPATQVAAAPAPPAFNSREQEQLSPKQEEMEQALERLEP